jgi:5-methylcytosine-specific restriction enzyme subunit McrC
MKVVSVREWDDQVLSGLTLTDEDRALARALSHDERGRLSIEPSWEGLRVRTRSWVGVIRVPSFELHIVPKLVESSLNVVGMIELTSGFSALHRVATPRTLKSEGDDLFDLIALLLAEACERLVAQGLLSDYVEQEDVLPFVRGRMLPAQQILRRFGQIDRVICRFDEQERDIAENRLLFAALLACVHQVKHAEVRRRIGQLVGLFEELGITPHLDPPAVRRRFFYHRLNEYYRDAHILANAVLDGLGIGSILESGEARSFAFLIDMGVLFERFVHRLVEYVCCGWDCRVHDQKKDSSIIWDLDEGTSYSYVVPDLIVEPGSGARARLPIDAKYSATMSAGSRARTSTRLGLIRFREQLIYAAATAGLYRDSYSTGVR